jgi:hypothetical protein
VFEINGLQRKIDISAHDYQLITLSAGSVDYHSPDRPPTRMNLNV